MNRWRSLALGVFLSATAVFGQVTGRVSGTVVDPSGAAIPSAKVDLLLPGGKTALLSTNTNAEGIFDFTAVRAEIYMLTVETSGFTKYTMGDLKVDPGRQVSLAPIRLALQSSTQTVEVAANSTTVDTATAEIASTVSQGQIRNLPVMDRQISNLFNTQAGVAQNTRTATVINGLRPAYANMTVDGVNIQDSVRTNPLDFIPNRISIAQVEEFTISTTNAAATVGGAAATVSISTPSGKNAMHGEAFWYNRNNHFAGNDWFSNMNQVKRPFLNLNQLGGGIGGPIKRDKLFYYANYEAYRQKGQSPVDRTILTPTARQGILQYRVGGVVQQFNVLQAAGLQPNSATSALLADVPTVGNNPNIGDALNTTGYTFNARSNRTRDSLTARGDYNLSPKNVFSGTFIWNREILDRTAYNPYYTAVPPIFNDNKAKLIRGSWRTSPNGTFTNELMIGTNLAPSTFKNRQKQPAYFLTGLIYSSPIQTAEVGEGRNVDMYVMQDNANWVKGRHTFSFGYQMQLMRVGSYNENGTIPSYGIGISTLSPYGFTNQIPGALATDYARANSLLASLAGLLSTGTQTFNATGKSSGFVSGAPNRTDLTYDNYSFYFLDNYKLRSNLTLTLGLRYEWIPPVDERNGLAITPVLINNNIITTALGNSSLDLTGGPTGRRLYNPDKNNFAPNIGLAWDVRGDGKTSVRAGYAINYVNDNTLNSVYNQFLTNAGLSTTRTLANQTAFANAPPTIAAPPFNIPTSTLEQFNLNPNSPTVQGMMDPNLRIPYVQQWNLSLQHDFRGWIFEGRYVANHAVKVFRALDYNQIQVNNLPGFVADFQRARSNMFLANKAGKGFLPAYDPTVAGSQQLTVLPSLHPQALTAAAFTGLIRTGEVGTYAQTVQSNRPYPGLGFSFFPNPYTLYASVMTNRSNSSYNSAQFEVRRRLRNGIQFQANYTFGKALSDAFALRALDPQLDNANSSVERARTDFDLTHAFKLNHFIPLPFGKGKRFAFNNAVLNKITEGWGLSGFLVIQSGSPISILTARGTLNRGARSGQNTADVTATREQLRALTGTFMTGNGPSWWNPQNYYPGTTRPVAPDGADPFSGQVLFNPQVGSLGNLQRRSLDGPLYENYNFSLSKDIRINERHGVEIHVDAFNIFNHANFYTGDVNINTDNFGKYSGQNYSNDGVGPRALQFGLRYHF
jgi:hypothetical protein